MKKVEAALPFKQTEWLKHHGAVTRQESAPEPLFARGRGQRWRLLNAEDRALRLHHKDEVEVCSHHDQSWQEGQPKTKTSDAATKGCSPPVDQTGKNG